MDKLSDRLKWLRKKHGFVNKIAAAKALGFSPNTYQVWEYGYFPNRKNYKIIADYYKCSIAWLQTGIGEPYPDDKNKYPEEPQIIKFITGKSHPEYNMEEFIFIGRMCGEISGGMGIEPENSTDEMRVAFHKNWIKTKGDPRNMSLIKVKGDSMEPTLFSGDHVLVDHGKNFIQPQGGIYAISIENKIMVKRIQVLYQGKVAIISDNKNYERLEIDASHIHINGKIIWYAREIEK